MTLSDPDNELTPLGRWFQVGFPFLWHLRMHYFDFKAFVSVVRDSRESGDAHMADSGSSFGGSVTSIKVLAVFVPRFRADHSSSKSWRGSCCPIINPIPLVGHLNDAGKRS